MFFLMNLSLINLELMSHLKCQSKNSDSDCIEEEKVFLSPDAWLDWRSVSWFFQTKRIWFRWKYFHFDIYKYCIIVDNISVLWCNEMTVIKSINGQVSVSNHYLQQVDQYWISRMFCHTECQSVLTDLSQGKKISSLSVRNKHSVLSLKGFLIHPSWESLTNYGQFQCYVSERDLIAVCVWGSLTDDWWLVHGGVDLRSALHDTNTGHWNVTPSLWIEGKPLEYRDQRQGIVSFHDKASVGQGWSVTHECGTVWPGSYSKQHTLSTPMVGRGQVHSQGYINISTQPTA